MTQSNGLLAKQGSLLLENEAYALVSTAILALIPFATWLAVAIVALITLRKGFEAGLKGLLLGIAASSCLTSFSSSWTLSIINAVVAFFSCYLAAGLLRITRSWRITASYIVLLSLIVILFIHWLAPDLIKEQFQAFQSMLKELNREDFLSINDPKNAGVIAHYIVGLQGAGIFLSAISSLMLARSIQSKLFYPGGYRQEMLSFRASSWAVVLLILAGYGAYHSNYVAISCLPLLVIYYAIAGISLLFNLLAKGKKGIGTVVLLMLPLFFLPLANKLYVMLIYVVLGALDSFFNFRLYLPAKTGCS